MTERLSGKVAVVIGAAQGIGRGIVERFAAEGARIGVGDLKEKEGRALVGAIGESRAMFQRTDVAVEGDVERLVAATLERFGRIDILVQNAGIYPANLIETTTAELWDRVLGVNLRGTFFAAKACVAPMRAAGGGRMVFTSSITGPRVAAPGVAAYAASKGGINGFIKVAALEFARYGITVNGVEPGNILTEGVTAGRSEAFLQGMTRAIPLRRLGTPADVANVALFLASEESAYVTGETIVVDGGQLLPESEDCLSEDAWQ